jgi:hypothetical protein
MGKRWIALCVVVGGLAIADSTTVRAGINEDSDFDGVPDFFDKCIFVASPTQCDHDVDGYGNVCDGDFDQNFAINAVDFSMFFIPAFKGFDPSPWPEGVDMDCNGTINANDFSMFFVPKFKGALGGAVPGPSGIACAGQAGCQ